MAEDTRREVPLKEAVHRIGREEMIHTFRDAGAVLLGADHDRDTLINAMALYGVEEAGETASAMGHTLVIRAYPVGILTEETTALFIEAEPAPASITCPRCQRTSYNPNDVTNRYCGFCHVFLQEA